MRRVLLFTGILLLFAAWAVAQQDRNSSSPSASNPSQQTRPQAPPASEAPQASQSNRTSPSASDQASQPSLDENSIEGCLGGTAGNYTIIDKSGTSYKLELPANANTSVLDQHIGQEVQVTGAVTNAADSGSSGSSPSSANQASIKVTHMSKVADTCTNTEASPSK